MRYVLPWLLFISFNLPGQAPADTQATRKTVNLLGNLHQVADKGFMFGHQDDLAYGVGWREEKGRSDVKEITGSFPAVFGWDIGHQLDHLQNIDSVNFESMKRWMVDVYKMKGINTISWHMTNWTTGGNSWDRTPSVSDILPGGTLHKELLRQLDLLADFLAAIKSGRTPVPVIFRPWHEHNGDWFWWGRNNCKEEEYIALYRFTVDYLRNNKNVHNLLYAFSPDRSRIPLDSLAEDHYFYGYPGDDYVDIIGLDNYADVGRNGIPGPQDLDNLATSLKLITTIARQRNKVAALTETGLEGVKYDSWFTKVLLETVEQNRADISLAWILVWRNANRKHHYAPYPGHTGEADFQKFYKSNTTFFQSDLKNPYKRKKALK